MAFARALLLLALTAAPASAADEGNPVLKAVELLAHLEAQVVEEGSKAQKTYEGYSEWCETKFADFGYEIKTETALVAELQAQIVKETSIIETLSAKIEDTVQSVATQEADLKAATSLRADDATAFAAEEKELVEIVGTLERAIRAVNREVRSGAGAAMVQLARMPNILHAFDAMLEASVINSEDAGTLKAFVQSSQHGADTAADDAEELGAPAAAAYEDHSGGIVETLEGLLEKAEGQLDSLRSTETKALHNFEMIQQSLQDEIEFATGDLAAAKTDVAASEEARSGAEGSLGATSNDLAADTTELKEIHHNCETTAADFEAATKSRDEELKALAAAKAAISEMTDGAQDATYSLGQVSFLQDTSVSDSSNFQIVRFVRGLARKQDSAELLSLANRIAATIRLNSRAGQDPFGKVKALVAELITSLESAAETDASHNAWCDKETKETTAKKEDKAAEVTKLSAAVDKMSSRIDVLGEEVATLSKDIAGLTSAKASYDDWFKEAEQQFSETKADLEQGLEGIRTALKIIRDYYAKEDKSHSAAGGAASGIVGLLEVVEADFSKGLAELEAGFANAKTVYGDFCKDTELALTAKNADVKHKNGEQTRLTQALQTEVADRKSVQAELDANLQYLAKIREMCVEKAEPYAERQSRREAELNGLKEALAVLDGEAVLLQKKAVTKHA